MADWKYSEMNLCSLMKLWKSLGSEAKQAFQVDLQMRKTQILRILSKHIFSQQLGLLVLKEVQ